MPEAPTSARPAVVPETIGRYEFQREIGRGAMGQVLLARDPILDREVAIKFLRTDLKLDKEERQTLLRRMRQEARASARLSHPNIVTLFDMGEDAALGVYLVFEHAEGITLKDRLSRGPMAPEAAARLALELGDALTTAHRAGVLHRDIKPENVIVTTTGAKIADFGIARVPNSTLTKAGGGLLGTPAYSSPEAITNGAHSGAGDQFSLAATLYEALAGQRAFPGDDAVGVATRIQTDDVAPIARSLGLPTEVDAVLLRGLAKDPSKRFSSCAEFGLALADSLGGDRPSRAPQLTIPDARHQLIHASAGASRPTRIALGGLLVGAVVTLIATRVGQELSETRTAARQSRGYTQREAWLTTPSDATQRDSKKQPTAFPPGRKRNPRLPSGRTPGGADAPTRAPLVPTPDGTSPLNEPNPQP